MTRHCPERTGRLRLTEQTWQRMIPVPNYYKCIKCRYTVIASEAKQSRHFRLRSLP
jgi:hypothetical protein